MDTIRLIVLVSVFAGVVCIDRVAAGQFMLSRPVVAAALLGLLCGRPVEGVIAGLVYELLFLDALPVGSFVPDQALFPSLLAVLMIRINGPANALPAAIILAFPSIFLDRLADRYWRRGNERIFDRAKVFIRMGKVNLAERMHRIAILKAALFNMTAFMVSCVILIPVYWLIVDKAGDFYLLFVAVGMVPFLAGLAGLMASHVKGKGWIGFLVGLVFGALVGVV